MKSLKIRQILLVAGVVLLMTEMVKVMFSQHATVRLEPKVGIQLSQTQKGEQKGKPSSKATFDKASRVLVFHIEGKQRKYVGSIGKDTPNWRKLREAVEKGTALKDADIADAEYEVALLGRGFYQWVKVDSHRGTMVIYTPGKTNKLVIRLASSINQLLAGAQPMKPCKKPKLKVEGRGGLLPPPTLEEVVNRASLILIGIPIDIIANEYEIPGRPHQHTVYAILVERYLKDETGLNLPVVLLNHYEGYLGGGHQWFHHLLPEIDSRYLFFLTIPRSPLVSYWDHVTRVFYDGEYNHYLKALLDNGWAEPLCEDVEWLRGKEQEVLNRVVGVINKARGKR